MSDMTWTCPACGNTEPPPCRRCHGTIRRLRGDGRVTPGRGPALFDFFGGLRDVARAALAIAFERDFIGRLRVPVLAGAATTVLLIAAGIVFLLPAYRDWFESAPGESLNAGPALWLFATWLVLGPPLLAFVCGFAQAPLIATSERRMLGEPRVDGEAPAPRFGERLLLLVAAATVLPFALGLVLVPFVGVPATVALGSAIAAVAWFDAPIASRGHRLPARLQLLRRNPLRALGTGLGITLLACVPVFNLLALAPVAAVAATAAWLHFDKR
jgi:hypothetical protein